MNSQTNSWFHLGINRKAKSVKRSSLSYANQNRNADLYESLFNSVLEKAQTMKESHGFRFRGGV
jgi:hypothetical protein